MTLAEVLPRPHKKPSRVINLLRRSTRLFHFVVKNRYGEVISLWGHGDGDDRRAQEEAERIEGATSTWIPEGVVYYDDYGEKYVHGRHGRGGDDEDHDH